MNNNTILIDYYCYYNMKHAQLGILIPAGTPLDPNAITSREVKSGFRNLSFSKSLGQGRRHKNVSADSTNLVNFALMALLTTATKPNSKYHQ